MENPLCRYCGKPMDIGENHWNDISYKCECAGYLKEKELDKEIIAINRKLNEKKNELYHHKRNSLYESSIRELKDKIREIERQFQE